MTLMDLKKSIKEKTINPLYIFTGDEIAVLNIYINMLSDMYLGTTVYAESVSSIVPKLKSNSLFDNSKSLFIIHDDKQLLSSEKVWESLKKGTFQNGHSIILIYNSLDKRGKFHKFFSDNIVYFDKLSDDVLFKYVNKDLSLSADNAYHLIHICSNSYNRLLLEMDKIKCLAESLNISHDKAFKQCLDSGAFYIDADGEIFDLLNSIMSRDPVNTYKNLQQFIRRGDSPLALLSLLHNNIKALLQVQLVSNVKDLSNITGLTGFQIRNVKQFVGLYTNEELIRILKINQFCEKCVKQTGMIDLNMILDFLFVRIF